MKKKYVLAIDQGTTGSRAFIYDNKGKAVSSAYKEFKQYYPQPGWVEHDAEEIWSSCVSVMKQAINRSRINKGNIAAIGITNQRETTVVWDRKSSKPVYHAIVWQCRRTSDICQKPKYTRLKSTLNRKTGLVLDPYFSGTKIQWILENVSGIKKKAQNGRVCFGTIDSWLIWNLTKGEAHRTDVTNASRTLIYNIKNFKWDKDLCKAFGIPQVILPEVQQSGSIFGYTGKNLNFLPSGIPICSVLGDQQAALYGQGCYSPGSIKNTYGTGCFLVLNTGKKLVYSKKGLLSTVAADENGKPVYAMEGSIFIAGAVVQWLRDELKVIENSEQSEKIIQGYKDTHDVYVVPAFAGLGAPYWNSEARGLITGLTRGANKHHIVRASLESIAYQTKDVFDIMKKEYGKSVKELKVDGGACKNSFLMQFQADILNTRIIRPQIIDSTVHGTALLAGVMAGLWKGKSDLMKLNKKEKEFKPKMKSQHRANLYNGWCKAIRQTQAL